MMARYTYATCLSFGTDGDADYSEVDVTFSFAVLAGRLETPPAYSHGGLPAEDAQIVDIRVEQINGKPVVVGDALTLEAILCKFDNGDLDADLLAAASKEETWRREEAADARRDYH